MFQRGSQHDLQAKLAKTDGEIADPPLSSGRVKAAHALIDEMGKDDKDALEKELAAHDLPSLEELGRIQIKHTFSWWKLHRDRKKLVGKLDSAK